MRLFDGKSDIGSRGSWTYSTADEEQWTGRDGKTKVIWSSTARYCTKTEIFCGRTPELRVMGRARPFVEAVAFAGRLGKRSKWIEAKKNRNLPAEQRKYWREHPAVL